jgi:hypothetical protein
VDIPRSTTSRALSSPLCAPRRPRMEHCTPGLKHGRLAKFANAFANWIREYGRRRAVLISRSAWPAGEPPWTCLDGRSGTSNFAVRDPCQA